MAIIQCPENMVLAESVSCAVCHRKKSLRTMSVGRSDLDGHQAFACDEHLTEGARLILGWTDYIAAQRQSFSFVDYDSPRVTKTVLTRGLYAERRLLHSGSLSWDLAHHLYTRYESKVLVITEDPRVLLSSVSKQWLRVTREVQRERSSTLNARRIFELHSQLSDMLQLTMRMHSAESLQDEADVLFVTPDQVAALASDCQTIYVTCRVEKSVLQDLSAEMLGGGVLVLY